MIKILNYRNNCEISSSPLVVIFGQVHNSVHNPVGAEDARRGGDVRFVNCERSGEHHKCLIAENGKFKFIFLLQNGVNAFDFSHMQRSIRLNLIFKRSPIRRCVKLYYVVCPADKEHRETMLESGEFQSKADQERGIENAKRRIGVAMLMLQTLIASLLPNRITFDLELDDLNFPQVQLFNSTFSVNELRRMQEEELWSNMAVELLQANRSNPNFKYLAFLSFSRYKFDEKMTGRPNELHYDELVRMTDCYVALGGDGLACLSSCSMFCWPERLDEIEGHFSDATLIDPQLEFGHCKSTYGEAYLASLGSVLHELCHTFDLGHASEGIMSGREFEPIRDYFVNRAPAADGRCFNRPSFLILSNHKHLKGKLKKLDCADADNELRLTLNAADCEESNGSEAVEDERKVFSFDRTKASLSSKNGIVLVEYRDSNSYTVDYAEYNLPKKVICLASDRYFKKYKNKPDACHIIVLDTLGNLLKFK